MSATMLATLRSRPPECLANARLSNIPFFGAASKTSPFCIRSAPFSKSATRFPARQTVPRPPPRLSSSSSPSSSPSSSSFFSYSLLSYRPTKPCRPRIILSLPAKRFYQHLPPQPPPPPPPTHHKHPSRDPRNPYGYTPYSNEHYVRLQAAKPLPLPSSFSISSVVAVSVISALIFYFYNLETVPVSGRTRFNVYSRRRVQQISEWEYKRLLASLSDQNVAILPDWDPRTALVKKVMRRLIPYSGMQDEEWEVFVVDDPRQANAFVLPGGKVFVFTGILGIARTESALAAVLGHEIAHNLAEHVGERLSADIGTNVLVFSLMVLGGVVGLGPLVWWFAGQRFVDVAFGYPMSRMQESEADYIGLMMMAEACYDPREAVRFWRRMEYAGAGNGEIPEWASTHPSNKSRIEKIEGWLGEAEKKREASDCQGVVGSFAEAFRRALGEGRVVVVSG